MHYICEEDERKITEKSYNAEAAMVLLVNASGHILMQHRDDIPHIVHPGKWSIPGGGIEDIDLTPEHAAIREVKEEINYDVSQLDLFAQTIDVDGRNERIYVYVAPIDAPLSELTLLEGQDMGFFSQSDLDTLDIVPFVRKILNTYFVSLQNRLA